MTAETGLGLGRHGTMKKALAIRLTVARIGSVRVFVYPLDKWRNLTISVVRYAFKTEPDMSVLPEYGDAQPENGY